MSDAPSGLDYVNRFINMIQWLWWGTFQWCLLNEIDAIDCPKLAQWTSVTWEAGEVKWLGGAGGAVWDKTCLSGSPERFCLCKGWRQR